MSGLANSAPSLIDRESFIDKDFSAAANEVLAKIKTFGQQVALREARIRKKTIGNIGRDEEKGPAYESQILKYIDGPDGLKKIANELDQQIKDVAQEITKLARKFSSADIDPIWLSLTLALEPLGRRPSKKFSALLIDENHNLVAWDVSHLCFGVEERTEYYVKGIDGGRGYLIRCAEIMVLARYLNMSIAMKDQENVKDVQAEVDRFVDKLKEAAHASTRLKKLTLFAGHIPCDWCVKALIKNEGFTRSLAVKRIVTQRNIEKLEKLTGPYRKPKESLTSFKGLPVRIICPLLNRNDFI